MVVATDTVVHPLAVVVEVSYTLVANVAMA